MNKKVLLILVIIFCVFCVGFFVADVVTKLLTDGYAYYGDGWQSTPEKALVVASSSSFNDEDVLTIEKLLLKRQTDDIVELVFISRNDTLVSASFVENEEGLYHFSGFSEEESLDFPSSFVVTGDENQVIPSHYAQYNTYIWGWCYSQLSITVNGETPLRETYVFDCQGKTWSLDYWWLDNIPPESEVTIEYIN